MTLLVSSNLARLAVNGALCYVTPKILTYLCTRPETIESRVDALRDKMAYLQETTKKLVGPKIWFGLTDGVADNAWICALIFPNLRKNPNPFGDFMTGLESAHGCIVICMTAYLIRTLFALAFPSTRDLISTRTYPGELEHDISN